MRYLFIDDDSDDQEFFGIALSSIEQAPDLQFASNGFDGIKLLQRSATLPDYIFLDLNMPKLNGKECLRLLMADARISKVPIVIFTTSSDPSDKKEVIALGAIDMITKPHRIADLEAVLRLFFLKHQARTDKQ